MSDAGTLAVSTSSARLTPQLVFAAWRGITREQVWTTFLLGCGLNLFHHVSGLTGLDGDVLGWTLVFTADQIKVFPLLLTVVVADRVSGGDPDHFAAYALAVALGALVGAALAVTCVSNMTAWLIRPARVRLSFIIMIWMEMVTFAAATVWVINDRRRARRASAQMHVAELERIDAEKRSIESDLQAMQARVEPQFLFNTLAQVRRLYEQNVALAERMLDDLIAYLRAAMPKMRDTSSTVGEEVDLARAYLDIVKVRLGDRLTYAIDTRAELRDARFPPMMLLPLIDHAITRGVERAGGAGSIRISVAEEPAGQLAVTVADSGAGFDPHDAVVGIEALRERLRGLFGDHAGLDLRRAVESGTRVVMTIPVERTEPDSTTRAT